MDIGSIIKAPLDDADWIKKCALIGLMTLIPIAGFLNLMGWQVEYTRNRLAGRTDLPEANLNYIGTGWRAFVSMLPLVGILIVAMIVLGIVGAILGKIAGPLALVTVLVAIPLYLAILVVSPLFLYRHIVHNDPWAGARLGWAMGVLKENVGLVVTLWVCLIIASIVSSIGSIVVIGFIITMPLAQAMMGAATAEFATASNRA